MQLDRRKILLLILGLILLLSIPLTIYLVRQQQEIRSRATNEDVTFILTPNTYSPGIGEEFPVHVFLNGQNFDVSGVDFKLSYNQDLLELVRFEPATTFNSELLKTNDAQNGRLRYVTVNNTRNEIQGQAVDIGTAIFRPKTYGNATITLQDVMVVAGGVNTALAVAQLPTSTISINDTTVIPTQPPQPPSENLITNGDFELGLSSWACGGDPNGQGTCELDS